MNTKYTFSFFCFYNFQVCFLKISGSRFLSNDDDFDELTDLRILQDEDTDEQLSAGDQLLAVNLNVF